MSGIRKIIELALLMGVGTVGITVMLKFGVAALGALLTFVGGVHGGADAGDRNRVDIKAGKFEVSWNGAARVGMIVAGILLIILAFMHDHVGT
jgi:hypothetical protein